jgi:hypothetical protein
MKQPSIIERVIMGLAAVMLFMWFLVFVSSVKSAPLTEADKERERVRVAIEIARARLHPQPVPVAVDPTPGVVVQPPITQGGTGTDARRVAGPSSGFPATYRMVNTPIPAQWTAQYGATSCTSYG